MKPLLSMLINGRLAARCFRRGLIGLFAALVMSLIITPGSSSAESSQLLLDELVVRCDNTDVSDCIDSLAALISVQPGGTIIVVWTDLLDSLPLNKLTSIKADFHEMFKDRLRAHDRDKSLLEPSMVEANIEAFGISKRSDDIPRDLKSWRELGARFVISANLTAAGQPSQSILTKLFDADKEQLLAVFSWQVTVEPVASTPAVPNRAKGKLVITTNSPPIVLSCDNGLSFVCNGSAKELALYPGSHTIRAEKKGYAGITSHAYVTENNATHLKIKSSRPGMSPVLGFISSACIPGSAGLFMKPESKVGKRWRNVHLMSGLLFYTALAMYIVDEQEEDNFFTERQKSRYEQVRDAELYTAVGAYALNVITGIIVGNQYANSHQRLEIVAVKDSSMSQSYYGEKSNEHTFQAKLSLLSF